MMKFEGTWHIYEMEMWDEDYFNMEVQAYIEINEKKLGNFQFGLVSGYLDGEVVEHGREERFEFTWEGQDENDPAIGSGWLKLSDENNLEGRIKLHLGDSSSFRARRAG
jgi:hypothetical protein